MLWRSGSQRGSLRLRRVQPKDRTLLGRNDTADFWINPGFALPLDFLCCGRRNSQCPYQKIQGVVFSNIWAPLPPPALKPRHADSPCPFCVGLLGDERLSRRRRRSLRPRPFPAGGRWLARLKCAGRELTWSRSCSPGFSEHRAWAAESRCPRPVPAARRPRQPARPSPASRARVWAARSLLPWSQREYRAAEPGPASPHAAAGPGTRRRYRAPRLPGRGPQSGREPPSGPPRGRPGAETLSASTPSGSPPPRVGCPAPLPSFTRPGNVGPKSGGGGSLGGNPSSG